MKEEKNFAWIRRHPLLVVVTIFFLADLVLFSIYHGAHRGVLTVAFLDVGQGDAVFIEAPNGNQLLYDAGPPSGAVLRALGEVMPMWDRSIDVAMFSHPDMDHIGGFLEVFNRYTVRVLLEPGVSSENGVWSAAENSLATHHIDRVMARKGMTIDMGSGVRADILYPDHDASKMETNSASIVLRIHFGDTSFLLSGDLPSNIEDYAVAQYGEALHAQVLKIGHHGSRTSSSETWLRAVDPDVAVISAGLNNSYGHPHEEVIERLGALQIPFLATYTNGTIVFESDGRAITQK